MSSSPWNRYFILTTVFLAAVLLAAGCISPVPPPGAPPPLPLGNLTFYTEEMAPYNYVEEGTLQGIAVDMLEVITEEMGEKVTRDQVRVVPWTEGYQAALTGNNTVLFTMARLPWREHSFKWAGPVYAYTNVLFARQDWDIVITGPGDLEGYRIGVIVDDAAAQELLAFGIDPDQLVYETEVPEIIRKTSSGEIDLWGYTEAAGRYFARQETGNFYAFKVVYTFPDWEGYYAFSTDVPDSTVQAFQQALDDLREDRDAGGISTYERVVGRHIPAVGLANLNYLTEEWAPYNYQEDGVPAGISVDVLEAVFQTIGVNRTRSDVRIVPLADGFRAVQQDGSTVLFSIVRTPEREPLYQWAGPFTKARFVLFAPVGRGITITSPADLDQYRIGVVRDSVENTLLTRLGVNASHIITEATPGEVLALLEDGQIDLWATGDLAGRHQMTMTAADPTAYEIVYTLGENDFSFIFSRDVPEPLVTAFQYALDAVINQEDAAGISEYERIINRYSGVGSLP